MSNLVPIRNGIAVFMTISKSANNRSVQALSALTLLKPCACGYHSLTEFSVDFRDKSNMNRMATASLKTNGNIMLTNSRPEKVIVVRVIEIVFSMKFRPETTNHEHVA